MPIRNGIQEVVGSIPIGSTIFSASAAEQPRPKKCHGVAAGEAGLVTM